MSELADRIMASGADIDAIERYLDGLAPSNRIAATRRLRPEVQRRLWDLAAGRAVQLDELVPPDRRALEPVRHYGRNTLPAFTEFEKRFCRPTKDGQELWGYNEGPTRRLVGPGYFVCRKTPGDPRGDMVIDYYRVPTERPAEWPPIQRNERGVSRLVYAYMHDFLRRVSAHVSIGRAWRKGRETPNCFVLCREG